MPSCIFSFSVIQMSSLSGEIPFRNWMPNTESNEIDIGPVGPEVIWHFANKCLLMYHITKNTICIHHIYVNHTGTRADLASMTNGYNI